MVFLSIELAAIATQRRDSIKQKIDIYAPLNVSTSPRLNAALAANVKC